MVSLHKLDDFLSSWLYYLMRLSITCKNQSCHNPAVGILLLHNKLNCLLKILDIKLECDISQMFGK